jgi:hypothetical protein
MRAFACLGVFGLIFMAHPMLASGIADRYQRTALGKEIRYHLKSTLCQSRSRATLKPLVAKALVGVFRYAIATSFGGNN